MKEAHFFEHSDEKWERFGEYSIHPFTPNAFVFNSFPPSNIFFFLELFIFLFHLFLTTLVKYNTIFHTILDYIKQINTKSW